MTRPPRVASGNPQPIPNMGFDQNDPRPIMNPHKKTTQVNLWMVVGVVVFFIAGAVAIWLYANHPPGS